MSISVNHEVPGRNDLSQDYFTLFGLPPRFSVDGDVLAQSWRRLQAAVHPDRFVASGAAEKRLAIQLSTQVNTAYRTLQDPVSRAAYLCELRGVRIDAERNTAMPSEFLVQQLQWREQLEEARESGDSETLRALADTVERARTNTLTQLARLLDGAPVIAGAPQAESIREAANLVRVLMFLEKFRQNLVPLLAPTATFSSLSAA